MMPMVYWKKLSAVVPDAPCTHYVSAGGKTGGEVHLESKGNETHSWFCTLIDAADQQKCGNGHEPNGSKRP